jgi:hypothetical protein
VLSVCCPSFALSPNNFLALSPLNPCALSPINLAPITRLFCWHKFDQFQLKALQNSSSMFDFHPADWHVTEVQVKVNFVLLNDKLQFEFGQAFISV